MQRLSRFPGLGVIVSQGIGSRALGFEAAGWRGQAKVLRLGFSCSVLGGGGLGCRIVALGADKCCI